MNNKWNSFDCILDQCFSNFNVYVNHLATWLEFRFWFSRSGHPENLCFPFSFLIEIIHYLKANNLIFLKNATVTSVLLRTFSSCQKRNHPLTVTPIHHHHPRQRLWQSLVYFTVLWIYLFCACPTRAVTCHMDFWDWLLNVSGLIHVSCMSSTSFLFMAEWYRPARTGRISFLRQLMVRVFCFLAVMNTAVTNIRVQCFVWLCVCFCKK